MLAHILCWEAQQKAKNPGRGFKSNAEGERIIGSRKNRLLILLEKSVFTSVVLTDMSEHVEVKEQAGKG